MTETIKLPATEIEARCKAYLAEWTEEEIAEIHFEINADLCRTCTGGYYYGALFYLNPSRHDGNSLMLCFGIYNACDDHANEPSFELLVDKSHLVDDAFDAYAEHIAAVETSPDYWDERDCPTIARLMRYELQFESTE